MRFEVTLSAANIDTDLAYGQRSSMDESDKTSQSVQENAVLPEISVSLTTYNRKGVIPMQKVTGNAVASESWIMSEDVFDGIINRDEFNETESSTLLGLLCLAVDNLLANM